MKLMSSKWSTRSMIPPRNPTKWKQQWMSHDIDDNLNSLSLSLSLSLLSTPKSTVSVQVQRFNIIGVSAVKQIMGFSKVKLVKILATCFVALSALVSVSPIFRSSTTEAMDFQFKVEEIDPQSSGFAEAMDFQVKAEEIAPQSSVSGDYSPQPVDKLLDGLLVPGFDEGSCLSRYQSASYRKTSFYNYRPSPYLVYLLRRYEDLHKRCGPYTELYNKTLELLKTGHPSGPVECSYIVWVSFGGLGNRILTLASTFLYALLTNRVLLVDRGNDMADLFCEPFPEKSWLLPLDFPIIHQFYSFDQNSSHSYGNMLKNNVISYSKESFLPSFLYLYHVHDYGDHDHKLFFCDQDQALLRKVPWLIMKTDSYFAPSLFLIQFFEKQLDNLFPQKETVFLHLGQYLFHPSNQVWGLITRYYQAYLAEADERIGIQISILDAGTEPFPHVMDQILACTLQEKILPQLNMNESVIHPPKNQKTKAVLITSSNSGYYEKIRTMYWEYPTMTREVIQVYEPSHDEEFQQSTEKHMHKHNLKAWAEMYLLSLTDVLVTSAWSSFGYVAQGLGGITPVIMYKPENWTSPDPPCRLGMSKEPCFLAPPILECKGKTTFVYPGSVVPYVRHCEDTNWPSWGVKLVDGLSDDIS